VPSGVADEDVALVPVPTDGELVTAGMLTGEEKLGMADAMIVMLLPQNATNYTAVSLNE
jgi:hypothetical protein